MRLAGTALVAPPSTARASFQPARMKLGAAAALVATLAPAGAAAEPFDLDLPTARRVARAGATLVSDDGVGALIASPASLARSTARRAEVDLVLVDDDASFRAADADALGAPRIEDRGGDRVAPAALAAGGVGRLVLAAGYLERADHATSLPTPEPGQPGADVTRLFPHRYAGTSSRLAIRTVALGGAARLGDAVGVGAALHLSDAEIGEGRTVWAGFAGRDRPGDPARDLALSTSARDPLVIGGALGILVAPTELPVEVALGARVRGPIRADGRATLVASHAGDRPSPVPSADPRASIALASTVALAAGARYLGERIAVEADVEVDRPLGVAQATDGDDADPARGRWRLDGVAVLDDSGQVGELTSLEAFHVDRSRWRARGAVDVAVVDGFLWLTAGYARASAGRRRGQQAPHAVDLTGHTVALGAEASWDDITLSLGYARTLSRELARATTTSALVNPFGEEAGTLPTGAGTYDASTDVVGIGLRVGF